MASAVEGTKAKTARRVIEVLEFFDEEHREATVMDIVRRYNRPQSSTSELLASLVELGLLYKDAGSRSYTLTPRAAILGSLSQPSLVRDGDLSRLIDRLVAQTGLGVALFGMVGLNAQVFRWTPGTRFRPSDLGELASGAQQRLIDSAAGWLLLSSIRPERREGAIRRLNAEAPADAKFNTAELARGVEACARAGYAVGPAGFGGQARMAAILLPSAGERPMALAFVHQPSEEIDVLNLVGLLQSSAHRSMRGEPAGEAPVPLMEHTATPVRALSAA